MSEVIKEPSHYKQADIETIVMIESVIPFYKDSVIGGLIWNVLKYVIRAPHKGTTLQDLKKSRQYLNRAINKLEGRDSWDDHG